MKRLLENFLLITGTIEKMEYFLDLNNILYLTCKKYCGFCDDQENNKLIFKMCSKTPQNHIERERERGLMEIL